MPLILHLCSMPRARSRIRRKRFTKKRTGVKRSYVARRRRGVMRRTAYRRRRGRGSRITPSLGGMRLPSRKRVKLVWKKLYQWNAIAAGISTAFTDIIVANSMYDPEYKIGVGQSQPLYYDQWEQFYNRYCVTGAKITYKLRPIVKPTANSSINVMYLSIYRGNPANGFGTFGDNESLLMNAATNPDLRTVRVNPNRGLVDSNRTVVSHTFSARKFFNKPIPYNEDSLCALTTQNPISQAGFCPFFLVTCPLNTDISLSFDIECTVTYNAYFFDRKAYVPKSV